MTNVPTLALFRLVSGTRRESHAESRQSWGSLANFHSLRIYSFGEELNCRIAPIISARN